MNEFVEAQQQAKGPGIGCWYQRVKDELDGGRLSDLDGALADRTIFGTTIASVLSGWLGRKVPSSQVQRHRNGGCKCE